MSISFHGPWIIGGDFNNVMHLSERPGFVVTLNEVMEFRNCVRDCGLSDHATVSHLFTWNDKHDGEDRVFYKIDRFFS